MASTQQDKQMIPLSYVPHDFYPPEIGRQEVREGEEREEWSTCLAIPGMKHPILLHLPPMKLPVCTKCKRQFKTRKYCRQKPRKHMSLPWSVTYLCLTFDDSCYESPLQNKMKTDKPFMAKEVKFDKSVSIRNHWRPFVIRENSETSSLMQQNNNNNNNNKAGSSSSSKSNYSTIKDANHEPSAFPMCKICKHKRYTGTFCRGKLDPHMYLPWNTIYYDVSSDDNDTTIHKTVPCENNVCSSRDKNNSTSQEAQQDANTRSIFDSLIGPPTNTLFVQMSNKECKVEWLDYDKEMALSMQKKDEKTNSSKCVDLLRTKLPRKAFETHQKEEEQDEGGEKPTHHHHHQSSPTSKGIGHNNHVMPPLSSSPTKIYHDYHNQYHDSQLCTYDYHGREETNTQSQHPPSKKGGHDHDNVMPPLPTEHGYAHLHHHHQQHSYYHSDFHEHHQHYHVHNHMMRPSFPHTSHHGDFYNYSHSLPPRNVPTFDQDNRRNFQHITPSPPRDHNTYYHTPPHYSSSPYYPHMHQLHNTSATDYLYPQQYQRDLRIPPNSVSQYYDEYSNTIPMAHRQDSTQIEQGHGTTSVVVGESHNNDIIEDGVMYQSRGRAQSQSSEQPYDQEEKNKRRKPSGYFSVESSSPQKNQRVENPFMLTNEYHHRK